MRFVSLKRSFHNCYVNYIFRESNMLGDSFAKHGLSISTDNCVFLSLPDFARNSFMEDVSLIDYSIIS